jgi:hypothetical protein
VRHRCQTSVAGRRREPVSLHDRLPDVFTGAVYVGGSGMRMAIFLGDGACKVTHAWAGMRDCFALATECGRARASHLLVAALPDLTLFRLPHSFSCSILRNPAPLRPALRHPLSRLPVVLWTSVFLLPIRLAATLRPDTIDRGLRTALSEQAAAEPSSYYSLRPPRADSGSIRGRAPSPGPGGRGPGRWAGDFVA